MQIALFICTSCVARNRRIAQKKKNRSFREHVFAHFASQTPNHLFKIILDIVLFSIIWFITAALIYYLYTILVFIYWISLYVQWILIWVCFSHFMCVYVRFFVLKSKDWMFLNYFDIIVDIFCHVFTEGILGISFLSKYRQKTIYFHNFGGNKMLCIIKQMI